MAIYLTDEETGETIVDRGAAGTALFTLSGDSAQFVPGQVRFDGSVVEIDVTTSPSHDAGTLLLQLINTDNDNGSVVTITPLSNSIDLQANPSARFQLPSSISEVGADTDTTALTSINTVVPSFENIRYDVRVDTFTAEIRLHNDGEPIGRDSVLVFGNFSSSNFLSPVSGTDTTGQPFLNFRDAIPFAGLDQGATSDAIKVSIQTSRGIPFSLSTSVLVGEKNRPPVLQTIPPITVFPGDRLTVPLTSTDPDGDPVSFSWTPGDSMPTTTLSGAGELVFTPTPNEIGQYEFVVTATDGLLTSSQSVQVTVAVDSLTSTRISGPVLNTIQQPLSGIPVELGTDQTTTAADGSFTLTLPGGVQDDTLRIRGEALAGQEVYPFIAEKLGLLLEQGFFQNVNNVISRPIYLPALDPARDPRKRDDGCNDCEDRVLAASEVATHSGALIETAHSMEH